jgi:hypothetical protein
VRTPSAAVLPSPSMDESQRPNVIPIGGFSFPAPPDWTLKTEAEHSQRLAGSVLGPEDLTLSGQPRCMATSRKGVRCANAVVPGSHICRFHGAGGKPKHPDDPNADRDGATKSRAHRIEAVRQHLELTAQTAVLMIESVLEDENAKTSDRIKAAEIVLDRTVGRHVQLEKEDVEERDLDEEIFALTEALDLTGTDDAAPKS